MHRENPVPQSSGQRSSRPRREDAIVGGRDVNKWVKVAESQLSSGPLHGVDAKDGMAVAVGWDGTIASIDVHGRERSTAGADAAGHQFEPELQSHTDGLYSVAINPKDARFCAIAVWRCGRASLVDRGRALTARCCCGVHMGSRAVCGATKMR